MLALAAACCAVASPPRTTGEVTAARWEAGDGPNGVSLSSLGNHRVRMACPASADAAVATIEWRRPDEVPASHGVLVTAAAESRDAITNAVILNVSRTAGTIAFDTRNSTSSAEFFAYWLPYTRNHLGQWGAVAVSYDPPRPTADPAWTAQHVSDGAWRKLPECRVVSYEARDRFNRFTAMEVVASAIEMADAAAAAHDAPFLVFPEDRGHTVRDFERLPSRFLARAAAIAAGSCDSSTGSNDHDGGHHVTVSPPGARANAPPAPHGCGGTTLQYTGTAQPGEYFVFQLVVWALRPLSRVRVNFAPLVESSAQSSSTNSVGGDRELQRIDVSHIGCVNTGGMSYLGQPFTTTLNVSRGKIQPLYIGVNVPTNVSTANLTGQFLVTEEITGHVTPVQIALVIGPGPPLADFGDSNPQQLSRVRWLDSTVGIDHEPTLGFQPLLLNRLTAEIRANGKTITINKQTGLPERIGVDRERRQAAKQQPTDQLEVLAAPLALLVRPAVTKATTSSAISASLAIEWCADDTAGGFSWTLVSNGTIAWTVSAVPCQSQAQLPVRLSVNGSLEFDGFMDFAVALSCESETLTNSCELEGIDLSVLLSASASKYASGLGERGSRWPPASASPRTWSWTGFANATQHGVTPVIGWMAWVGGVSHGLRLKLKGEESIWEQPEGYAETAPRGWAGLRSLGNLSLSPDAEAVLSASSGPQSLGPGTTLKLKFDVVVTPVKQRDPQHFKWRYLMGCGGCDGPRSHCPPPTLDNNYNVTSIGVNAVILHQGEALPPADTHWRLLTECIAQ